MFGKRRESRLSIRKIHYHSKAKKAVKEAPIKEVSGRDADSDADDAASANTNKNKRARIEEVVDDDAVAAVAAKAAAFALGFSDSGEDDDVSGVVACNSASKSASNKRGNASNKTQTQQLSILASAAADEVASNQSQEATSSTAASSSAARPSSARSSATQSLVTSSSTLVPSASVPPAGAGAQTCCGRGCSRQEWNELDESQRELFENSYRVEGNKCHAKECGGRPDGFASVTRSRQCHMAFQRYRRLCGKKSPASASTAGKTIVPSPATTTSAIVPPSTRTIAGVPPRGSTAAANVPRSSPAPTPTPAAGTTAAAIVPRTTIVPPLARTTPTIVPPRVPVRFQQQKKVVVDILRWTERLSEDLKQAFRQRNEHPEIFQAVLDAARATTIPSNSATANAIYASTPQKECSAITSGLNNGSTNDVPNVPAPGAMPVMIPPVRVMFEGAEWWLVLCHGVHPAEVSSEGNSLGRFVYAGLKADHFGKEGLQHARCPGYAVRKRLGDDLPTCSMCAKMKKSVVRRVKSEAEAKAKATKGTIIQRASASSHANLHNATADQLRERAKQLSALISKQKKTMKRMEDSMLLSAETLRSMD